MLAHARGALLKGRHLFLVADEAQHIVARHDAQFPEEGLQHLEVAVAHAVEHDGVDVFKYDVFLYQCYFVFVSNWPQRYEFSAN
jgi:hypothetical protein